jgi:uncharacterized delta-60 repeat protein
MGIMRDASRLPVRLFRDRKTVRSSAAVRRGLRTLRPMAEDLEGRTLMSVGLDGTYGLGGVAVLVPPPNTATTSGANTTTTDNSENVNSIALQNGQAVGVGTLSINTDIEPAGTFTSTSTLIAARFNTNGSLDSSFGLGGTTSIPVTSGGITYNVSGEDIVVQSNGMIDLLGTARPASPSTSTIDDFVVAQLNSNGSLNTSFGTGGFTLIDFSTSPTAPASDTSASALALSPNGSIVAVGSTTLAGATPVSSFAIARLNPNGSLDTTFNGTGMTTSSFNTGGTTNSNATASGVVVTSSGTVIVVGEADVPTTTVFTNGTLSKAAVVALNVNGTPFTGFNGTGQLTYSYNFGGTSEDSASGVVIDGSSIAIVGTSRTLTTATTTADAPSPSVLTVTRLTASGSFDTSFNGTGMFFGLTLNQGGVTYATSGSAIVVLPDNSILVGGSASDQNNNEGPSAALLANLSPSGALNTSYGTNGVALIEPIFIGSKLLVQTDGKVVFGADGGVARTTAPAPVVTTTTIVTTGTGKNAKASGVTIAFNTAINPVLLSNLTAFTVRPMKGKKAIKIKKGGLVYNAATQTLTINFATKMKVGKGFQVLIMAGGVVAADGQVLFNGAVVPILINPTT